MYISDSNRNVQRVTRITISLFLMNLMEDDQKDMTRKNRRYMMIHPDKIGAEAKIKEDENFKFRSYLKGHADEEELDKQFFAFVQRTVR